MACAHDPARFLRSFYDFVAVNTILASPVPEDDPEVDLQNNWQQFVDKRYSLRPDQLPKRIELEISPEVLRRLEERSRSSGRSSAEIALEIISAACPPPPPPPPTRRSLSPMQRPPGP
jgi:hypothetical protein